MPRDGSNNYNLPFPDVVTDTTIESAVYNGFTNDVALDLNTPRPILHGGTGANNARDAMINLSGEIAKQVVANYDSHPFVSGSFYSDNATGHAAPIDGHAFMGICYLKDDNNIVVEARDQGDTTTPGRLYVREKKAGVWGPWVNDGLVVVVDGDDIGIGITSDAADMTFGLRGTAPDSFFAVNTESDGSGTNAFRVNKDGSVVFAGNVTFPATPPVNPTDATNKAYVDDNFVELTGDTMTGQLTAPTFSASANAYYFNGGANFLFYNTGAGYCHFNTSLKVDGTVYSGPINCAQIYATGTSRFVDRVLVEGGGQPCFAVHNSVAHQAWGYWVDSSGAGGMLIGYTDAAGNPIGNVASFTSAPGFTVGGTASKPGGGAWSATSDARIKNVSGDYTSGLDAVTALNPVRFTYKGNDGDAHKDVADKGTEFVGLVAQDAEGPMPEMVSQFEGSIDGVAVSDLRHLDTTPLIFALVNAVKELKARLEALEAG